MADFAKVAQEVLQLLQSYDYTVMLYDDEGMKVAEPEEARRFFDRAKNLMVVIEDDDDNSSISLSYGKTTHANDIMGLDLALKTVATKFSLLFIAKQFGKQIEPKDVTSLGSLTEIQDTQMILSLTEGMYGTTRSSYLRLEHARMVVRHSKKINDSMIGARGRCVESIFIENDSGERLLFPSTQLAPARAMTQHVNHGGSFADPLGGEIMRMTEDYSNLSQASNYVANNSVSLSEDAMVVHEACRGKMRKLRKTFEKLSKHSSYAKESQNVLESTKTLNETDDTIDETRLSELRQLLNGADLSKEVYECAGKAMAEMKEQAALNEVDKDAPVDDDEEFPDYVPSPATTVGVLGYRVNKTAWRQLDHGILVVTGPPRKTGLRPDAEVVDGKKTVTEPETMPSFPDRITELCFRLGNWVPVVADVTLANLLSNIVQKITAFKETGEIPVETGEFKPNARDSSVWRKNFIAMKDIALKAVKARKVMIKAKEKTGMGVPAVAEHYSWLARFDPDQILAEDMSGLGDWGDPIGDGYDTVKHDIVNHFSPEDFATSPEVTEMVGDRNPTNPEENHLDHHDIAQALRAYVQREMETFGVADSFSLYMTDTDDDQDIVDTLYDDACEALQKEGWVVEHTGNMEMAEADFDDDDFGLTMDDVMIPTPDQGGSLIQQVSKAVVRDPDHKDHVEKVTPAYISRLQTLGGIANGGQNGQSY